ncbi:PGRS repeat-containing protein [Mycobacterium sp. M26]|uniref:PGRS repeat-containing protein n=1 Tax=Mycobacterium sp. M26 TaxID=1762962 RepID=UPI00073EF470|nr:hypothetical protein [Mycobacterium sp. M26]
MVRTPEPPTFAAAGVLGAAILGAAVALFPSPDTGARHVEGSAITLVSVDAALAPADLWWLGDGSHRVGRSAAQPSALAIDPHVELFGTLIIGNGADGTAANPNGGNGGLLWGNGGAGYTPAGASGAQGGNGGNAGLFGTAGAGGTRSTTGGTATGGTATQGGAGSNGSNGSAGSQGASGANG